MSGIIKRKVDSKGRVVLPFKDVREVLIAKLGRVIIASPERKEIEKILQAVDEYNKRRKLEAIEKWFKLVDKAGLSSIKESEIRDLIKKGMLRDIA